MHFIGIDIGTSSISSVAYDFSSRKIESTTRTNGTSLSASNTWEKLQDPATILKLVEEEMDDFSRKYTDIKGIGVTGQMHGMVYIDKEGEAVSPLYTWQDGRGNQPFTHSQSYAEYLSEQTGYPLATGFGLVTHFYNLKNGLVPENAAKLCTIMDYVVMKLSGRKTPLTDYSNGASLGFFDLENLRFDIQALKAAGIDPSILPDIDESATLTGHYKGSVPVYSAIGDNQAAFMGSVRNIHQSIHITVGTSSQLSIYSDKFVKIPSLDTRPFPGGGYILVGAALCGGSAFAMLNSFFEQTLRFFEASETNGKDIYKTMISIPYPDNPEDIPEVETLFDGTRYEPWKRGSISQISSSNLTPQNLIIGFLRGISSELYTFYNAIPDEIKAGKDRLVGSGNGLKMNPLLCKAFEDKFNYTLELSTYQEEAAFGACLCGIKKS